MSNVFCNMHHCCYPTVLGHMSIKCSSGSQPSNAVYDLLLQLLRLWWPQTIQLSLLLPRTCNFASCELRCKSLCFLMVLGDPCERVIWPQRGRNSQVEDWCSGTSPPTDLKLTQLRAWLPHTPGLKLLPCLLGAFSTEPCLRIRCLSTIFTHQPGRVSPPITCGRQTVVFPLVIPHLLRNMPSGQGGTFSFTHMKINSKNRSRCHS